MRNADVSIAKWWNDCLVKIVTLPCYELAAFGKESYGDFLQRLSHVSKDLSEASSEDVSFIGETRTNCERL